MATLTPLAEEVLRERCCTRCKVIRPTDEFSKDKNKRHGLSSWCKKCCAQNQKNYYINNRKSLDEKGYFWFIKKEYGITKEQYEAMALKQNNRCLICQKESGERLHVDHNHETGEIRGLLCRSCNLIIGRFEKMGIEKILRYLGGNNG